MAYIGNPAAPTLAQVADDSVTSAKIADGAVTPSDLSTGHPSWDSSGNVGIGTSSSSAGGLLTLNRAPTAAFGSPILQIGGSSYTSGGYYSVGLGFTDATYTEPPAEIAYVPTSDSGGTKGVIVFGTRDVTTNTAVSEKMRLTNDGYLRMASGTKGIQFGGDTAAANALDDYEEGTWTPVLSTAYGFTEGASPSYTGKYIKIGKQVTVFFTLDFDASDTPAADDRWRISGLPFINADTWVGGGTFIQAGSWASDTNMQGVCTAETDEIFGHNVKINGTPPTYATTPVTGAVTYQTN